MDCKLSFDDNALFRHAEVAKLKDWSQEDPRDIEAHKHDLNYIGLDGSIGCLGRISFYGLLTLFRGREGVSEHPWE